MLGGEQPQLVLVPSSSAAMATAQTVRHRQRHNVRLPAMRRMRQRPMTESTVMLVIASRPFLATKRLPALSALQAPHAVACRRLRQHALRPRAWHSASHQFRVGTQHEGAVRHLRQAWRENSLRPCPQAALAPVACALCHRGRRAAHQLRQVTQFAPCERLPRWFRFQRRWRGSTWWGLLRLLSLRFLLDGTACCKHRMRKPQRRMQCKRVARRSY
jgi:hypothetical protein